jgi:hypothetical protein
LTVTLADATHSASSSCSSYEPVNVFVVPSGETPGPAGNVATPVAVAMMV